MESPAESVCGSTGEPPTPSSPEKSDPSTHCLNLQRENNKLKRKVTVLKEKAEGTEELLAVHRELRTKHTELQLECDDLRLKQKDEDQLKRKLAEAENQVQEELENRAKLQKQLSEVLERCESEQGSRISLLEQLRTEQETMVSLRNENATLKRKLDQLTDEQKRTMTNWKEFEHDMTRLMNRTGFGFGSESGLIKEGEIDLKTPEIMSQICSDLAAPSDGHSVDLPAEAQAKSTPLLESSRLSHESTDSRIKPLRKQQVVPLKIGVIRAGLDGSKECPGGSELTAKMIMNELKSCVEEDSVLCLVSRTLTALQEKHITLSELIRTLCDCFLTCSSSIPVLDTPSNEYLSFLIPWCEAGSTDHTFFNKIMVFILQLDDRMEADLVKCVSSEILDTAMGLMEQNKYLTACSLIAGLGQLCKTKSQNQILSIALVEILSIDKNSTLIPVLCVLLHSCPELLTRTPQFQQSLLFELLVGCMVEIITRILNSTDQEDPVVEFCSQKILSCGFQHHWWSSCQQPLMTHQPLTVKLPTGLTSDQQIEKFLTLYKQLLTSKEGLPIPEKAWFELELGFVIISKHKGYHWIQGITSALIVHWIKDLEQKKVVKLGRVMGSVYARLLTRWKDCSNQFLGVLGMLIECLNHFEKRSLKPRSFLRELLDSSWKVVNTGLDDGKWREWDVRKWEELKRGIVELRSRCDQYDVTSTLSESVSERLTHASIVPLDVKAKTMDFGHQVDEGESGKIRCEGKGLHLKEQLKTAIGSLSDTGSGRICAGTGEETDSWTLMSMAMGATVVASSDNPKTQLELCNSSSITTLTPEGMQLVQEVAEGFENSVSPEKSEEGLGGTYFMADATGQHVAIFKPCDEEPFAPCNPKGFVGRALGDPGLKPTVPVGEAALREVAAYLLDHNSFAKIPTTLLMRASHPIFNSNSGLPSSSGGESTSRGCQEVDLPVKLGSMQEYVSHFCDTTEMGTSKFSVSDVQRIAILDIRLYNTDRHAGNILVRKIPSSRALTQDHQQNHHSHQFGETGYELIPIDHGFCLPEALEPPYFEWQHWSQARMPLGEKEREYIKNIDIEADKALLRSELPVLREESLRTMEVSTTLLKKCVAAGLSLNEIAEIMTRPLVGMDKEKSDLEKLCLEARDEIWLISHSTSDSEASSDSPRKTEDQLMFKMDDWKDLGDLNLDFAGGLHSPFYSPSQMEECMEQLALDSTGENNIYDNNQPHGIRIPPKTHRSMSMAFPSTSVCFQKRRGSTQSRNGRRESNDSSPKRTTTTGGSRVAYPPLIQGSVPASEDQVFHHVSHAEWPWFMEILSQKIDEGLKTGKWIRSDLHKVSMSMNFGISCPRF